MTTILFVTGMFRSGTTLLARMLDAHAAVALASDPYLPFFKTLRSDVAAQLGLRVEPDAPLDDYYFSAAGRALFAAVQAASLDRPFEPAALPVLRRRLRAYGEPYAPRVIAGLDALHGASYAEVFASMVALLRSTHGRPEATVVGFKEVWADEFIPCLARSVPQAKFVQIVRDPRAVAASKNARRPRYPWLFLGRQWRKLAALAWAYEQPAAGLGGRVLRLAYEDLVQAPAACARRLCDFLGIAPAPAMADPAGFRDGRGEPWRQNTSYGEGAARFDAGAVDRWRRTLSAEETGLIDALCAPEMRLLHYRPESAVQAPSPVDAPRVETDDLAPWIRELGGHDPLTTATELAKERLRHDLLGLDAKARSAVPTAVVEGAFLLPDVLEAASREDG